MKNKQELSQKKREMSRRFERVVRGLVKQKGMTITKVAERMGYEKPQGFNSLMSTGNPGLDKIIDLASALDMSPVELISRLYTSEPDKLYDPDQVVMLPYLSASGQESRHTKSLFGTFMGVAPAGLPMYPVSRQAFGGRPAADPDKHMVIQMQSNNMAPELGDNSLVVSSLVEPTDYPYQNGGVYAVMAGTEVTVQRIKENHLSVSVNSQGVSLSGEVTLASDNPAYKPITIPASQIKFIGKVFGAVEKPVS